MILRSYACSRLLGLVWIVNATLKTLPLALAYLRHLLLAPFFGNRPAGVVTTAKP